MSHLIKYLKKREEAIFLLFEKPRRSFTPTVFHKLRIELKKLNAFLNILNYSSKGFPRNKTFKPFKSIFQQAGKVRELQVEELILINYFKNNLLTAYTKELKTLKLKERQTFFELANESLISLLKIKFDELVLFIGKIHEKKLKEYIKTQKNKIRQLIIPNNLQTSNIHKLRKQLKTYYYSRKILDLNSRDKLFPKNNGLQELLGKWHDCQIIIRHFNKAIRSGGLNPKELSHLISAKKNITSSRNQLLNKIKTNLLD